jgi:hypothetical protein
MSNDPKYTHIGLGPLQHCNRLGIFNSALMANDPDRDFNYLEIGAAHASTLAGMCAFFDRELKQAHWRAIGVDIPSGWCFNKANCERALAEWYVPCKTVWDVDELEHRKCTVIDCGSLEFLRHTNLKFNLVFIDGCHSAVCAAQDFVLVEPLVQPGGVVIFHDADYVQQGSRSEKEQRPFKKPEELFGVQRWIEDWDIQPHCGFGIGVRKALHCLDLLNGKRPGWKLLYDVTPDISICGKEHNPDSGCWCRGSCFFQKIA